ncbi:histone deacetylase [Formosa sediminum]|uniref:Histone deacetylase n=1 Tax=Formosa sediminum TaxID=2594004 RepID=A0A516GP83_9FLAO|nr:histone deacetylase [Formosa sediminum]QDO93309.1 histone deacetylase [Formosa sediminum]
MLKIAYHPYYIHPLKNGHRFPMEKYELIRLQLLHEGTCTLDNFFEPKVIEDYQVIMDIHDPDYVQNLLNDTLEASAARKIGLPFSSQLVNRELIIVSGTLEASKFALQYGIAMNIAGGTHHAYSGHGEGFCILNDQAIAANYLLKQRHANRILIIDLDVHQGNGTAEIFKDEARVFTFSMHGKHNYPFDKEQSDLDIALDNDCTDNTYLKLLKNTVPKLISEFQPDFIFYQCGVDVIASDKLGKLGLTLHGCKDRDRFILETCKNNKIPVVCNMGGGYSPQIKTIVDAHANTYRLAQHIYF